MKSEKASLQESDRDAVEFVIEITPKAVWSELLIRKSSLVLAGSAAPFPGKDLTFSQLEVIAYAITARKSGLLIDVARVISVGRDRSTG